MALIPSNTETRWFWLPGLSASFDDFNRYPFDFLSNSLNSDDEVTFLFTGITSKSVAMLEITLLLTFFKAMLFKTLYTIFFSPF